MELAEALQNGMVAPRRPNLDSLFLHNPLYLEGAILGAPTQSLEEKGMLSHNNVHL